MEIWILTDSFVPSLSEWATKDIKMVLEPSIVSEGECGLIFSLIIYPTTNIFKTMKNKWLDFSGLASAKVLDAEAIAELKGGQFNFECDGELYFDMTVYQIDRLRISLKKPPTRHCP